MVTPAINCFSANGEFRADNGRTYMLKIHLADGTSRKIDKDYVIQLKKEGTLQTVKKALEQLCDELGSFHRAECYFDHYAIQNTTSSPKETHTNVAQAYQKAMGDLHGVLREFQPTSNLLESAKTNFYNDPEKARKSFLAILERKPTNDQEQEILHDAEFRYTWLLMEEDRFDEALKRMKDIAESDNPFAFEANYMLGRNFLYGIHDEEDYDQGNAYFEKCREILHQIDNRNDYQQGLLETIEKELTAIQMFGKPLHAVISGPNDEDPRAPEAPKPPVQQEKPKKSWRSLFDHLPWRKKKKEVLTSQPVVRDVHGSITNSVL